MQMSITEEHTLVHTMQMTVIEEQILVHTIIEEHILVTQCNN